MTAAKPRCPKGWRVLHYPEIEKRGDKIRYQHHKAGRWLVSDRSRWGEPVSRIVTTIRRIPEARQ